MPVYEYECQACHQGFEYQQRMADPEKTVCEACGGALERVISRTAFQLKGGGWYKDLYSSTKTEGKAETSPKGTPVPLGDAGGSSAAPAAAAPAVAPAASSSGSGGSGGSSSGGSAA
jgi:putative FmdB family regulatory protein